MTHAPMTKMCVTAVGYRFWTMNSPAASHHPNIRITENCDKSLLWRSTSCKTNEWSLYQCYLEFGQYFLSSNDAEGYFRCSRTSANYSKPIMADKYLTLLRSRVNMTKALFRRVISVSIQYKHDENQLDSTHQRNVSMSLQTKVMISP